MTKSEVFEIKKQLTQDRAVLNGILVCYVGINGERRYVNAEPFYRVPEAEQPKYLEMARKVLSGRQNICLFDVPVAEGDGRELLKRVARSELKDETLNGLLLDRIAEGYQDENYCVTVLSGTYEVPEKTLDQIKTGESDETYSYVIVSVSPAGLTKPGLTWYAEEEKVRQRDRNFDIGKPDTGFLYPAFNGRTTDTEGALFFMAKEAHESFTEALFGAPAPVPEKPEETKKPDAAEMQAVPEAGTEAAARTDDMPPFVTDADEKQALISAAAARNGSESERTVYSDASVTAAGEEPAEDSGAGERLPGQDGSAGTDFPGPEDYGNQPAETGRGGFTETAENRIRIEAKPSEAGQISVAVINGKRCIVLPEGCEIVLNGRKI